MLFSRWGAFVYRFRRPIAILTLVLAIARWRSSPQASGRAEPGGWTRSRLGVGASSATGSPRSSAPGAARSSRSVRGRAGTDARSRGVPGDDRASLDRPRRGPDRVDGVVGYAADAATTASSATDGHVGLRRRPARDHRRGVGRRDADELRALIDQPTGADAAARRRRAGHRGPGRPVREGARPGGAVSGPFALLILLAGLRLGRRRRPAAPRRRAWRSRPTLAGVFLVAQTTELSIYVQNVATMLGLALAIDYSLFMVSRFREELRRGRTVGQAVETTVATSGKAVAFSGLAVAIGLSGLLLFEPAALRSFGIGGSIVVAASVFYALTFLPAVLGMLGHRVNALSLAGLLATDPPALGRPTGGAAASPRRRAGSGSPTAVMARPVVVPHPDARLPAPRRHAVPAPRAGHPERGDPAARASRAATPPSPSPTSSRPARPRRSRSWRPSRAIADERGQHRSDRSTTRAALDALDGIDRVEGPFSDLTRPADRRRARRRGASPPCSPPRATSCRRSSPPASRPARGRLHPRLDRPPRRDQPDRPGQPGRQRRHPGRPGRRTSTASPPRSAASPPRATTSWPARATTIPCAVGVTLGRERADPVPALRLGRDPDQGRRS